MLQYAAVTPARDEEDNLRRLAATLASTRPCKPQSRGSSSTTAPPTAQCTVRSRARRDSIAWIRLCAAESQPGQLGLVARRPDRAGVPSSGLEAAQGQPDDVIVKLDADRLAPSSDDFERLLEAFVANPRLGIAGSTCLEERAGRWAEVTTAAHHVRGAVRAYRRECLAAIGPLSSRR